MLWDEYPQQLDELTLEEAYETLQGNGQGQIPFWVRFFENPASPLPMPGKISLYDHDCLHLLLRRGFAPEDEAYIVGFTMGKEVSSNRLHRWIYLVAARWLFPAPYRFRSADLLHFHLGWWDGKKHCFPFQADGFLSMTVAEVRSYLQLG